MNHAKRPVVIVGNWKMHKTIAQAVNFVAELKPIVETSSAHVNLAVPFTCLHAVAEECKGSRIVPGAQNMYDCDEGPYTGEISGTMLQEAGAQFVILGHSERRRIFHESNEFVNKKIKKALDIGLTPIVCIGESEAEREQGSTIKVLTNQLRRSLTDLDAGQIGGIMLAYEPVWAIGTDQVATPTIAQEIHLFCRRFIANQYGAKAADKILILYGGSVKPDNAAALIEQKDVDGFLVGGASLTASSFGKIVHASESEHLNYSR